MRIDAEKALEKAAGALLFAWLAAAIVCGTLFCLWIFGGTSWTYRSQRTGEVFTVHQPLPIDGTGRPVSPMPPY